MTAENMPPQELTPAINWEQVVVDQRRGAIKIDFDELAGLSDVERLDLVSRVYAAALERNLLPRRSTDEI